MRSISLNSPGQPGEVWPSWPAEDMTELSLLLPGWQAARLEKLAYARGLTLGQLLLLLVQDYLALHKPGEPGLGESPAPSASARAGEGGPGPAHV